MKTLVAIWILVGFTGSFKGPLTGIEFYSKEQCEAALVKLIENSQMSLSDHSPFEKAFCIYKGDPQEVRK